MRRAVYLLVSACLAFSLAVGNVEAAPKKKVVAAKTVGTAKHKVVAKRYRTKVVAVPLRHRGSASSTLVVNEAGDPALKSSSALVIDQSSGVVLFEKNADAQLPIASITKLMTAMVALDAKPNLSETLTISQDELDVVKGTHSRLRVGTQLTREEMLRLALMASENRAAAVLSRYYLGGREEFVAAMNRKAAALGLTDTHFEDPTGLTASNVSSARDLTKLVAAAHSYPLIREFSTTSEYQVTVAGRPTAFHNTNSLVRNDDWEIGLSKTGYINEAGKCLVMQAWLNNKPLIIVLLDSWGKQTRIADANRIKRWIESVALLQRPTAG
jgi:D-alanyl-D-alanine endopeptidase (penicillin-binding protein 7)